MTQTRLRDLVDEYGLEQPEREPDDDLETETISGTTLWFCQVCRRTRAFLTLAEARQHWKQMHAATLRNATKGWTLIGDDKKVLMNEDRTAALGEPEALAYLFGDTDLSMWIENHREDGFTWPVAHVVIPELPNRPDRVFENGIGLWDLEDGLMLAVAPKLA